jgi:hypothetical protein
MHHAGAKVRVAVALQIVTRGRARFATKVRPDPAAAHWLSNSRSRLLMALLLLCSTVVYHTNRRLFACILAGRVPRHPQDI